MSGGAFDYLQERFYEIYDRIEEAIELNEKRKKGLVTDFNGEPETWYYSDNTIKEFKSAVVLLKLAEVYAHRIDWLLSCDDSEESFHEGLEEDLQELKISAGGKTN